MRTKLLLGGSVLVLCLLSLIYFITRSSISADSPGTRRVNMSLIANPNSLKADNIDQTTITASLPCGKRSSNIRATINFTTTLGLLSSNSAVTNSTCQAVVTLKSAAIGQATIRATGQGAISTISVSFVDPNSTPMFSDDFSGDLSKWKISWTGFGTIQTENGEISLFPKPVTPGEEFHSALVTAGDSTWKDYTFESRIKTIEQLQTPPDPWDAGCFVLRYQDDQNFYYLCHKPNGLELDRFENGIQYYLATPLVPVANLNQWYNFKITAVGNNIKVWVDGTQYINYTDTAPTAFLSGPIGFYSEEAHVHFDDVKVTAN